MVRTLSALDVAQLRADTPDKVFLLDVRELEEREAARIEPSTHIPLQEVPSRLSEIPRDRTVVVYCHTGTRSAMVAGFLEAEGFRDIVNLAGGIEAWSVRVDPKVPRYSW
jgi:rhodanese-related sulfurtransferase